ncbi:hypothetical protein [Shimia sagamensis]|uniref:Uncharacterized protein n=1 Tax=Shimia sagamensis TaxID=1566352 RepID=A0ABY1PFX8_9RHOB|nr:hypothetical protein [Shimia sagamensis]SMP32047.1 hypothetical protein SAMN06265373_108123 [Shimia sagamensis]
MTVHRSLSTIDAEIVIGSAEFSEKPELLECQRLWCEVIRDAFKVATEPGSADTLSEILVSRDFFRASAHFYTICGLGGLEGDYILPKVHQHMYSPDVVARMARRGVHS